MLKALSDNLNGKIIFCDDYAHVLQIHSEVVVNTDDGSLLVGKVLNIIDNLEDYMFSQVRLEFEVQDVQAFKAALPAAEKYAMKSGDVFVIQGPMYLIDRIWSTYDKLDAMCDDLNRMEDLERFVDDDII